VKRYGAIALGLYVVHALVCVARGCAADALWSCHVATLLVGIGLLMSWRTLVDIGALWLFVGTPAWLVDIALGGELIPTSVGTHLGGAWIAWRAIERNGLARSTWWKAIVALGALQQVCRWITPPAMNVNAAFAPYSRCASWFGSYAAYLAATTCVAMLAYLAVEVIVTRTRAKRTNGAT
jgi:hypothetical protein